MNDFISRQAAIDAVRQHKANVLGERKWGEGIAYGYEAAHEHICGVLAVLPSAQPDYDLSGYSDRLWQAAYERGKAEAEVKHGEWTIDENDPEHDTYCSRCGFVLDDWIQGAFYSFCPNCGADMRKETEDGT